MFERFTDRSRRILVLAQEEARELNHNFIGTEHLLLGMLAEGQGVAAKALDSLGVSLDAARKKVEEIAGSGNYPAGSIAAPPFTPRAKKMLEFALREALQLGHNYIGTEHIVLGLVREANEGGGVGAKVLTELGVELKAVRDKVIELLGSYAPPKQSDHPPSPRLPLCSCGASLASSLRVIEVTPGSEALSPVQARILFCSACGHTHFVREVR